MFYNLEAWVLTACSGFCLNSMVKHGKIYSNFQAKEIPGCKFDIYVFTHISLASILWHINK